MALAARRADQFLTNAEVLQELLHVYRSRRLWSVGREVFWTFAGIMAGRIEAILPDDAWLAAELADTYDDLAARDLIHLAVMNRLGVTRVVSADSGFDRVSGIERLDPGRFSEWKDTIPDQA